MATGSHFDLRPTPSVVQPNVFIIHGVRENGRSFTYSVSKRENVEAAARRNKIVKGQVSAWYVDNVFPENYTLVERYEL